MSKKKEECEKTLSVLTIKLFKNCLQCFCRHKQTQQMQKKGRIKS